MENNEDQGKDGQGPKPKRTFNFYWIYGIIVVMILAMGLFNFNSNVVRIDISDYDTFLKEGDVKGIVVNGDAVLVTIKKDALKKDVHKKRLAGTSVESDAPQYSFYVGNNPEMQKQVIEEARSKGVGVRINPQNDFGKEILQWLLFFGAIVLIWMFMMRRMGGGAGPGGQIFNIGKSRAQVFEGGKSTEVTFDDVAGLEGAKEEVQEIVDFLKNPKKYTDLGAKIPKGALLIGPPGTGKTLLAKAVAGEAKVPFFSLSGSDFVEMFVGVGASRVRDLFKQAKAKAPSIIFIDEIDAVGRARGRGMSMGANDERENTLNQLLTEMDGFGANTGVIILAATNRADVLDRALLRPGRFDRQIFVDMPDLNERIAIFQVHLKPLKLDIAVDVHFLARQTPGFSGADIANICNEAALIAARKKKSSVDRQDFMDAVDRIIGGLEKKNKIISDHERRAIAFHEAGHATVSWLVEHASPLVKVTIVPRGRSLGAAWYLPDERHITTTEQMLDEICAALGGRAAEDITFGKISTGALNDLEKVTKQAYAMVTMYGLNSKVGNISFYDSSGQTEYSFNKPYSERTAEIIDEEVRNIVETQYKRAKKILSENKPKLETLAEQLLEKEVIFKEDLETIFGDRPFAPKEDLIGARRTPPNGNPQGQGKEEVKAAPPTPPSAESKGPPEPDQQPGDIDRGESTKG